MMGRTRTTKHRLRSPVWPGLGSLLTLIVLLFGVPTALVFFGGSPANIREATPGAIWTAISSPDSGQVFVIVVVIVGWLAWASFAVATVVECVNWIGKSGGRRVPLLGAQQRLAAGLIAAIVMMTGAPAMASAAAAPVRAAAVAAPYIHTEHTEHTLAPVDSTPAVSTAIHHVARGETLLDVAEQYGVPSDVIAAANVGRIQPDGGALATGQSRLYPGWQLQIPTDATPSTMASAALAPDHANGDTYVVKSGDYLGDIAQRTLGEFDDYRQIAALNPKLIPDRTGPHGPDHIEPGWKLQLPPAATDHGPQTHATGTVTSATRSRTPPSTTSSTVPQPGSAARTPKEGSSQLPAAPAPALSSQATPPASSAPAATPVAPSPGLPSASAVHSGSQVTPSPSAAASSTSGRVTSPADATPAATDISSTAHASIAPRLFGSLACVGVIAAVALGAVRRLRRTQQSQRPTGTRIPNPRGGTIERDLRRAEQPADVDRIDQALRYLAAGLAGSAADARPNIVAVALNEDEVDCILAGPSDPAPVGWIADGAHWRLPASVDLDHAPVAATSLLPTLVTVASQPRYRDLDPEQPEDHLTLVALPPADHDAEPEHLLIDLEAWGTVAVCGDDDRSRALLRSIAAELACNPWADGVEVAVAGFAVAEAEALIALNPDRIRSLSSLSVEIARLRSRVITARATLEHEGHADTFAWRIADPDGEIWAPEVLLVADPNPNEREELRQLANALTAGGRCAVAIVATWPTDEAAPNPVLVTADGMLQLHLPHAQISAAAAGMSATEIGVLAEFMRDARSNTYRPAPPARLADIDAEDDASDSINEPADGIAPPNPTDINVAPTEHTEDLAAAVNTIDAAAIPAEVETPSERPPTEVREAVGPRREATAAARQSRRARDPHLDRDVKTWHDPDSTVPRIAVLGPVEVRAAGKTPPGRLRFYGEILVYLAQAGKRGADRHQLTEALWPDQPVKQDGNYLRAGLTHARQWLGRQPDGEYWLPEAGPGRIYRLNDGVLLDAALFQRLRIRGEAHGPAGIKDLRTALELVRGEPLDGADRPYAVHTRNPYTWLPTSDVDSEDLKSAVVDVAHRMADMCLKVGDTAGARWAVAQGCLADPGRDSDELWIDLIRIEHDEGHDAAVSRTLASMLYYRDCEDPEELVAYMRLLPYLPEEQTAPRRPSPVG